jgi:hypothetical protein
LQDPPKLTQIGIFGLNLATLLQIRLQSRRDGLFKSKVSTTDRTASTPKCNLNWRNDFWEKMIFLDKNDFSEKKKETYLRLSLRPSVRQVTLVHIKRHFDKPLSGSAPFVRITFVILFCPNYVCPTFAYPTQV